MLLLFWKADNAEAMGPKRDFVGEFMTAARDAGMKAGVATHYGCHWAYCKFRPEYDNWDPNFEGLYGHRRSEGSMVEIDMEGARGKKKMGAEAARFTVKDNVLYAICFGWPDFGDLTIKSLTSANPASEGGIQKITMLGSDEDTEWEQANQGLKVLFPTIEPCEHAYVLKIVPKGELLFNRDAE
jgi:hypothetical protein